MKIATKLRIIFILYNLLAQMGSLHKTLKNKAAPKVFGEHVGLLARALWSWTVGNIGSLFFQFVFNLSQDTWLCMCSQDGMGIPWGGALRGILAEISFS